MTGYMPKERESVLHLSREKVRTDFGCLKLRITENLAALRQDGNRADRVALGNNGDHNFRIV